MSDENLPDIVIEPTTDIAESDRTRIEEFKTSGLPGVSALDEQKLSRILDLYLTGTTYGQIAIIMRLPKPMILYLSDKFNWFALRKEYLRDTEQHIHARLTEAKLADQDFLLKLTNMWRKKIGHKISEYFVTGNAEHASQIDLKEVDKYMKAMEMLHKLSAKGEGTGPSPVGLNLGEGVTIERKGDNTVEITPKTKAIDSALKAFADSRREERKPK